MVFGLLILDTYATVTSNGLISFIGLLLFIYKVKILYLIQITLKLIIAFFNDLASQKFQQLSNATRPVCHLL